MDRTKDHPEHPMVPVAEAIRLVLRETANRLPSSTATADVPVAESLHRIVAQDIYMLEPGYPPFAASILDGYAIRRVEVERNPDTDLRIVGRVHAGDDTAPGSTDPNVAIYVTTGAKIPDGWFDCVVGIEHVVESSAETIQIQNVPNKSWIRAPGCDIPAGTLLLQAGDVITPVELGLLLQAGHSTVPIRREIKVGIVSSGNELASDSSWLTQKNGKIPDVNGPMLLGMLRSLPGIHAKHFGVVRDDSIAALTEAFGSASKECDILITTGGISMGDADLVEDVMVKQLGGQLHFGRLHMKPGKPSTFITLPDDTLVFCLPGNPVSAYVCAHLLVQPCLDLLSRGSAFRDIDDIVEHAPVVTEQPFVLKQDLALDFERPEYHRIQAQTLVSTGIQQSSRLMSCQRCLGLVVLPQATTHKQIAAKGEAYTMLMIHDPSRSRVCDSAHLANAPENADTFRVKMLQIGTCDESLANIIERDFNSFAKHQRGQGFKLIQHKSFLLPNDLSTFTLDNDDISTDKQDLTLIVGPSSLRSYSLLANRLRTFCTKHADAMALRVMQQGGDSHVRECVIGFKDDSCLIMYSSPLAMTQGLPNMRDLLTHAIQVSKGK